MNETSKAMRRRWCEDELGQFPWKKIFTGKILDIGCGPDPVPVGDVTPFDQEHGDANIISQYFKEGEFDLVHASQCLEHMHDPKSALLEWIKVCRKGGHIVFSVPDLGMYERFVFPSVNNPDHKASFSMFYQGSPFAVHVHLPSWLKEFEDKVEVVLCHYVERNFDWNLDRSFDQTWDESAGVELWNEVVLRRK